VNARERAQDTFLRRRTQVQLEQRRDNLGAIRIVEKLAATHGLAPFVEPRANRQQQSATAP
jgi:hypothetical protein